MTGTLIDRLARTPAAVVAVAFVLGALLADVHVFVVIPALDRMEPPQWTARVGIMLYFLILPLALLAVWARRRHSLGRAGQLAAGLILIQIPCYLLLTVSMLVWGLSLRRGDLGDLMAWVEGLGVVALYLGVVVLAVRLLFAGRANATVGALILAGFLASFAVPFLLTALFAVLAGVLLAQEARSRAQVAAVPAH